MGRQNNPHNTRNHTLCWDCACTTCNWHKNLGPVEGWKIRQGVANGRVIVEKCPEYIASHSCMGQRINLSIWKRLDWAWEDYGIQYRTAVLPLRRYRVLVDYLAAHGVTDLERYYGIPVIGSYGVQVTEYRRWKKDETQAKPR